MGDPPCLSVGWPPQTNRVLRSSPPSPVFDVQLLWRRRTHPIGWVQTEDVGSTSGACNTVECPVEAIICSFGYGKVTVWYGMVKGGESVLL